MDTKKCSQCGKDLPLSKFWKKKQSKDGLFRVCIECYNKIYYSKEKNTIRHREYRDKNKPIYAPWGGIILRDKTCSQCSRYKTTCPVNFDVIKTDFGKTCKNFKQQP